LETHHLTEAVAALDIQLAVEDIAHLEAAYRPGPLRTAGFKEVMAQQKQLAADKK
jgi:1-deoxyxylulose-5-phosphate synthase